MAKSKPKKKARLKVYYLPYLSIVKESSIWNKIFYSKKDYEEGGKNPSYTDLIIGCLSRIICQLKEIKDDVRNLKVEKRGRS